MCFAEVQQLQEQVRKLQADAADEGRRRAQVDSLEQKVTNLEGELQAAQRQCDQVNKYTHIYTLYVQSRLVLPVADSHSRLLSGYPEERRPTETVRG